MLEIEVDLKQVVDVDENGRFVDMWYTWTTKKGREYKIQQRRGLWWVKVGGGFAVPELEGGFISLDTVTQALRRVAFRTEHKSEYDKMNYDKRKAEKDADNTQDSE